MSFRWSVSVALGMLIWGAGSGRGVAVAQMSMAGHDMGAMKEIPPPEKLPVPLKMTGIGNSHLAITANSRGADVVRSGTEPAA